MCKLTATAPKTTRKVNPNKIATEYFAWINYYGWDGPGPSAYAVTGRTIPVLMREAFRYALYALGNGYRVRLTGLVLQCSLCHGSGDTRVVKKDGTCTKKVCRACRGEGALEHFADADLMPMDATMVVNDCLIGRE